MKKLFEEHKKLDEEESKRRSAVTLKWEELLLQKNNNNTSQTTPKVPKEIRNITNDIEESVDEKATRYIKNIDKEINNINDNLDDNTEIEINSDDAKVDSDNAKVDNNNDNISINQNSVSLLNEFISNSPSNSNVPEVISQTQQHNTSPLKTDNNNINYDDDSTFTNNDDNDENRSQQRKRIIKRFQNSYEHGTCTFCNKNKSNHWCKFHVPNLNIYLEGDNTPICGSVACIECRLKWPGEVEEYSNRCKHHVVNVTELAKEYTKKKNKDKEDRKKNVIRKGHQLKR